MGKGLAVGIATTHPIHSKDWDFNKNSPLTPANVSKGSDKVVWWKCKEGHEIRSRVNVRVKGSGCPVCSNRVIVPGFNDILSQNPELALEWNYEKNFPVQPNEVGLGSNKRYWWRCSYGHEWEISPNARRGCPFCNSSRLITRSNDLATTHPEIAAQWHSTLNGSLKPTDVIAGSHKKIWWICEEGHEWESPLVKRKIGRGCHVCTGQRFEQGLNDLATTNPELISEWHPTLNSQTPDQIRSSSEQKVWWICQKGHEWEAAVKNRAGGSGCVFCARNRVLPGFNDLETLRPDLAADWHPTRNESSVSEIAPAAKKIVWWMCKVGHEYQMNISNRYMGQNCPICSNQKVLAGFNDLATTRPKLAAEWHPTKNTLTPEEVTSGSNKKYWWVCSEGHEWSALLANRSLGNGCPRCAWTGFDVSKSAVFYFLQNSELGSRKVGITNQNGKSHRIERFVSRGWEVIATFHSDEGHKILELETAILKWIRKELGLPVFLGKEEMGKYGGWTETFSSEGIANKEILEKILSTAENLGGIRS